MNETWKSDCGGIQLFLANCDDILPTIEHATIISDPPYGISYLKGKSGRQGMYRGKPAAESRGNALVRGDERPFCPTALLRFSNVLIWGANHYAQSIPAGVGRWLAWNKLEDKKSFDSFSDVEFAWHSKGKASRLFNFLWKGIACRKAGEDNGKRFHPTQKPVGLMQWCLEQSGESKDGIICDPYMGAGTTGVACIRSGWKRFVGIEIVPKYFNESVRRIELELTAMKGSS